MGAGAAVGEAPNDDPLRPEGLRRCLEAVAAAAAAVHQSFEQQVEQRFPVPRGPLEVFGFALEGGVATAFQAGRPG